MIKMTDSDINNLKDVLTVIGRILYVMGKEGKKEAKISYLRKKVSTGIYQILPSGVKKGYWNYDIMNDKITLTDKGLKYAEALAKIRLG